MGQEYSSPFSNLFSNDISFIEGARDCGQSPVQQNCITSTASVGFPLLRNIPCQVAVDSCFCPQRKQ